MKRRGYWNTTSYGSRHSSARTLVVAIVFLAISVAFMIAVAAFQIRGSFLPPKEEGTKRTYTVPGLRGEIYDRNGNLLVGNATTYDLVYEYGAMPDTRREINDSLLAVLDALSETGNGDKRADDLFILKGSYPNMKFVPELQDKDSAEYYHYKRFLDRQEMERADTDAEDVMNYFVKRYGLSTARYTDAQITELIRLYYEMERVDFGQYQSYTIAKNINRNLITRLEESNIEGVNFDIQAEREYAYPGVASHILGQLGKITAENAEQYIAEGYPLDALVGISGCEMSFEEYLRGQDGVMVIRYDDDGNQIEKYYEVEPIRGNDVYLTIDLEVQIAAEESLKASVDDIASAKGGAITVLDPNSGETLALASYPTYDLTKFDSVEYYNSLRENARSPLLNRALQGVYPPGSTYKIGAAMAGLESGAITKEDTMDCQRVYPKYDHPTCLGEHGHLDVIGAIRYSCNVFFYHLGDLLGVEAMTDYTTRLGLGVDTGLELGNAAGNAAVTSENPGDTVRAAIGQSTHGYTPLQMSVYLSSVVNGGTRYRAHLLGSVRKYYTGEIVYAPDIEVLDTVAFSGDTYDMLMDGMARVISESELYRDFSRVGVTVGGKTGTAEITGRVDYALFMGFAPLVSPELVVSCVIEEGKYGSYAARATVGVFEEYFADKT
ncbi:MAG: hypothetical protein J6Q82_05095 [Clostridia bacterium]|nr:hypothetical protein [Clostridia bacterium]